MQTNQNNQSSLPNVFKSKAFTLLFLGTLVSNIGTGLYNFAISFYVLEITNNNAIIQGIYLATCGIVFVLCSPIGGVLADRWNKIKIIFGSDYIKGFTFIISGVLLIYLIKEKNVNTQLIILFIGGIISNMIGAIFSPASSALIPQIVKRQQLQQANSYFNVLRSFEGILSVLLAGVLYAAMSITTIFFFIGICYILSAISEMFIKIPNDNDEITIINQEPLTLKIMFKEFKEGFTYLLTKKGISTLILGILFVNFFITPFFGNGMPFFIKKYLTDTDYLFSNFIEPEFWQSIFSIFSSFGSLIMGLIIGSLKQKEKYGHHIKKWLIILASCFIMITIALYLFVETNYSINTFLIILCFILFFSGIIIININVPVSTILQREIEQSKMAKVMSLVNIGSTGLTPFASLIGGLVIGFLGLGPLFIFCSLGFIVTSIFISTSKKVSTL